MGQFESNFRQPMLVRVAHYAIHAWQCRNFFRGALGIASRHHNPCLRILPAYPPDGGARILIGGGRDRARIQYDDFRVSGRCAAESARGELAFQSGSVGLGGATSEILYVVAGHISMLAQEAVKTQMAWTVTDGHQQT